MQKKLLILTLSGLKSGNSSVTSTFAYFDGSIAANGVSSLLGFSDFCLLKKKSQLDMFNRQPLLLIKYSNVYQKKMSQHINELVFILSGDKGFQYRR